jgi:predicted esterase
MTLHPISAVVTARYGVLGDAADVREVWVALHGYGQLAAYFGRHLRAAERPGRLIVVPEAPSRFYLDGGPDGRYERVGATWATRAMRDADVSAAVAYLDDVLVAATARADVDIAAVPLAGVGFSQGAGMLMRWADRSPLLARRRRRLHRAILWGGGVPPDVALDQPWLRDAALTVVAGARDPIATPARMAEETTRLAAAGVPFAPVTFDGEHRMNADVLARLAGPL